MDKLLLRPIEAARLLGICRSKLYTMLATGELPVVRIGRSVRVPVDALRLWIDSQAAAEGLEDSARPSPDRGAGGGR